LDASGINDLALPGSHSSQCELARRVLYLVQVEAAGKGKWRVRGGRKRDVMMGDVEM
jgi:hypothetical protein